MHNNVQYVCKECCSEKARLFQEANKTTVFKVGQYVKVPFSDESGFTEHMWVEVKSVDAENKVFIGELNNDPIKLTNVKCGDTVSFQRTDIEELYTG